MKDVVPLLVSAVGFILSVVALLRTSRNESLNRRQQYNRDFRVWANQVIESLSDARHLHVSHSEDSGKAAIACRLSALADSGRLFFQNKSADRREKTVGFSGYRPRILDWIICAYKLLEFVDSDQSSALREMQVGFTRDAQLVLSPGVSAVNMKDLDQMLNRKDGIMDTTQSDPALKRTIAMLASKRIDT